MKVLYLRINKALSLAGGFNSDVFPLYLHGYLQRNESQVKTQAIVNA